MRKTPGRFGVGKACADRACQILKAGGVTTLSRQVPLPSGRIITSHFPWDLITQLKNKGSKCFTGYTELDANGNFRIVTDKKPR